MFSLSLAISWEVFVELEFFGIMLADFLDDSTLVVVLFVGFLSF